MNTLSVIDNKIIIGFVTCEQLIALQRKHESGYKEYPFVVDDNIITAFYNNVQSCDNLYLLLHNNEVEYPDSDNLVKILSIFGVTDYRQVSEWQFNATNVSNTIKFNSDYRTHFISCLGHEEYTDNVVYVHVIYKDKGEVATAIRNAMIDEILNDLQ